jgi:hypothetical protein
MWVLPGVLEYRNLFLQPSTFVVSFLLLSRVLIALIGSKINTSGICRLSLSTTFGGSPVVALSPFCLLVANVNTLMAQFLFVFLSGAGKVQSLSFKLLTMEILHFIQHFQ